MENNLFNKELSKAIQYEPYYFLLKENNQVIKGILCSFNNNIAVFNTNIGFIELDQIEGFAKIKKI